MNNRTLTTAALATLAAAMLVGPARALPPGAPPRSVIDYPMTSGVHNAARSLAEGEDPELVFASALSAPGAPWMQVHFSGWNLGFRGYIILRSAEDGDFQRLDGRSLPEWNNASGIFNGDLVSIEVYAMPGDTGVFVDVARLVVGKAVVPVDDPVQNTLCGSDSRTRTTDNRTVRLFMGGCTGWLASNGALLTAGHCVDFDPDLDGPGVPNGIVDLSGVVEINVPGSDANGTPNAAPLNSQFPIRSGGISWQYISEQDPNLGFDWGIFLTGRNANTGLTVFQAAGGFFRTTNQAPGAGSGTIRITGYGIDDSPVGSTGNRNSDNVTCQTSTGPYVTEGVDSSTGFWHEYQTDTEPANSGSPIIWENSGGYVIGVHTNGGCDSQGGGNYGTSFETNILENALDQYPSNVAVHLDGGATRGSLSGTIFNPFRNFIAAYNGAPNNADLSIVAGTYSVGAAGVTLNKPMRLVAPSGTVVIQP